MSDLDHQIETLLTAYREASPQKNLNFLASQVQARLLREAEEKRFSGSLLTTVLGSLQLRFAAIGVAFMMGGGFGLMSDSSYVLENEFAAFSHQSTYLTTTLLSQYE